MKILCVSETEKSKCQTDFLANHLREKFGADLIYTKRDKERFSLSYRVIRKIGLERDLGGINKRLLKKTTDKKYDIIFIIKGNRVSPFTLQEIKSRNPSVFIFSWSGDNMTMSHNRSLYYLWGLKHYDGIISINIPSYKGLSSIYKGPISYLDKCADDFMHLRLNKMENYDREILFVGSYEKERTHLLNSIGEAGMKVDIYGAHWHKCKMVLNSNLNVKYQELIGLKYTEAIQKSKITLGFLRKMNKDTQTSRTFEIPACGGFMLMERTPDHTRLFEEGKEAEFFSSKKEMLAKLRFYLKNPTKREEVAKSGQKRVKDSEYLFSKMTQDIFLFMRYIISKQKR